MRSILLSVLALITFGLGFARAADKTPAAYVIEVALAGADAEAKTIIRRDGTELPAKLMMPLYAGDEVFLRDRASVAVLELGSGQEVRLGGDTLSARIEGEIETGDSTWGIISAIGDVFAGEGDQVPENMVSKGGAPKVPAADRGGNLITARTKLMISWIDGKGPYAIVLVTPEGEKLLAENVTGFSAEVTLPEDIRAQKKFTLVLRDAEQQKVTLRFRLADAQPEGGPALDGSTASLLARAAWLTTAGDGAWRIEALQLLGQDGSAAAKALAARITAGWTLGA